MPLDNIDDLFRGKLDGHATPPSDDLWARLQAQPAAEPAASGSLVPETSHAERLDQLFQTHLSSHVTPPARALWERLEDEHLRPRKHRAAAWWPLAIAAAIALLITAGGAGLWQGFPARQTSGAAVAGRAGQKAAASTIAVTPKATTDAASNAPIKMVAPETTPTVADAQGSVATPGAAEAPESLVAQASQKKAAAQATPTRALASSASKARKFAERQSPRHQLESTRQPDAATPSASLVARTTAPAPAPIIAQTTSPTPAAEIVPTGTIITVDVRNGAAPAPRSLQTTLADVTTAEEPAGRRGLGGRLLQQAGHLVRGERLSLAEATGLPENVTLRANIAGHRVSKSIQL